MTGSLAGLKDTDSHLIHSSTLPNRPQTPPITRTMALKKPARWTKPATDAPATHKVPSDQHQLQASSLGPNTPSSPFEPQRAAKEELISPDNEAFKDKLYSKADKFPPSVRPFVVMSSGLLEVVLLVLNALWAITLAPGQILLKLGVWTSPLLIWVGTKYFNW